MWFIPVALAAGGVWWWKFRKPAPVQAPPYQAPDGKVYPSPFQVDGNMPANIAQAVTQMIMLNNNYDNLMQNANWMQANNYPVAAKELLDKAARVHAALIANKNAGVPLPWQPLGTPGGVGPAPASGQTTVKGDVLHGRNPATNSIWLS